MANSPAIFSSLKGKKITLQGKFDREERKSLKAMIEIQQGDIVEDLNKSVDYLLVADLSSGTPAQKKARALNANGASIQVLDIPAFDKIADPTDQQIALLIRGGKINNELLTKAMSRRIFRGLTVAGPALTIRGENFDGVDLSGVHFRQIRFEHCSFKNMIGTRMFFAAAIDCDFTRADLEQSHLWDIEASRFHKTNLNAARLGERLGGCDFTGAIMRRCQFDSQMAVFWRNPGKAASKSAIFKQAVLTGALFRGPSIKNANFEQAELQSASFIGCDMPSASFRGANLQSANFSNCRLPDADFSDANVSDVVFEDTEIEGAKFDNAELSKADFASAKTDRADFSKAKNYAAASTATGAVGTALTELDSIVQQAKRIDFEFKVKRANRDDIETAGINTGALKYGWGIRLPSMLAPIYGQRTQLTASDAMLKMASRLRGWKVHYETLEVSSTKSPKSGKELREIVLNAISEAFAQPLPPAEELAKATKEWREGINKATSKEREARKLAKEKEEKAKAAEKKKLAKKIEKEVGKVTDVATFLKALELRVDVEKIKKATKMLRAERFQLFNDVTDAHLNGVVKSQTDADLVYACRIEADGKYACCTQNLNICGGLRGSICKHLLVLIIGLVQAGKLDPQTIDEWVAKSLDVKAELNKETMGEIFIRYKGAEAGEVDWRPTETMPEDYYAL